MTRKTLIDDDVAQYDSIMRRLRRLEQGIPEDVHLIGATGEPTFQNSWVNYDTGLTVPSPPSRDAGFYRHQGRVYLTGVVKNGTVGATVFILPDGYRPALQLAVAVSAATDIANLDIFDDGRVQLGNRQASSVAAFTYLEGASFRHA